MSTSPVPSPAPAVAVDPVVGTGRDLTRRPPEQRGVTILADRVVEKTAARVAGEVAGTQALPTRLADRFPGRSGAAARADATISGRLVQLRITVGIRYPLPIVSVTRAVRAHVRDEVGRLCNVEVRDVDVVVADLQAPQASRRVL